MDLKITTYQTLRYLVDIDKNDHKIKDIARLFLEATNDWPSKNSRDIYKTIHEFKALFGDPLTIEKISHCNIPSREVHWAWMLEAGSSLCELIELAKKFYNISDFDSIVDHFLGYYEQEFARTDFLAKIKYRTRKNGGLKMPVTSGYSSQFKFEVSEMETAGRQTFTDKKFVLPGDTLVAKVKLLKPEDFRGKLADGMTFELNEKGKTIGRGQIQYIVNSQLQW